MMDAIRGERLTLRPMTRAEFHSLRMQYEPDILMDPNPYIYAQAETDAAYDRLQARQSASYIDAGIFTDDSIIGMLSFKRIDPAKGRCELGLYLANDRLKGKGYGTEAFRLATRHAFDVLGLSSVYADTMGSNARMQHILEKLGFRCFMRMERHYDMGTHREDRLDYILQREENA